MCKINLLIYIDFSNLLSVDFVGDGTYLNFEDKFLEIRPSGTDAKTKAYAGGSNKELLAQYSKTLGNYSGELNDVYKKYLSEDYVNKVKDISYKIYLEYANKDADKRQFNIPNYEF